MEHIIVTAQKREQSLQDVPLSVDVLRGEKLDVISSGARDILFLAARSPSLYAESSSGRTFPRFYIRGLGNTDFDLNASQPVSLVYDDVVLENAILKGFPVFDMEQIEIVRGPQGTLFGRNTPAGVIKFESVKPTMTPEGYLHASYGRFDTIDMEGAYSMPLIANTLAARAAFQYQQRDDFVNNTFTGGGNVASRRSMNSLAGCSSCMRRARISPRCSMCTAARSTADRACSAPTSSGLAPVGWSPISTSVTPGRLRRKYSKLATSESV